MTARLIRGLMGTGPNTGARAPRPKMLMDAILKLHDQIRHTRLGANRDREITELEQAAPRRRQPLHHPRDA